MSWSGYGGSADVIAFRSELLGKLETIAGLLEIKEAIKSTEVASVKSSVAARTMSKSWGGMSLVAGGLARGLGGVAMAAGVVATAVAYTGLKFDSMKEQATIAFTTMLHSADLARKYVQKLYVFAAKTPFQFPDVLTFSRRLIAFGFAANDVLPILTHLGDAASALGQNQEGLARTVLAIGEIKTSGLVQAKELRQLSYAGIPAWQILAQGVLGSDDPKSMQKIRNMVRRRQVTADKGIPIILEGLQKRYGGMMDVQSRSLAGRLSTSKDILGMAAGGIMQPFIKPVENGLGRLNDLFFKNQKTINRWSKEWNTFVTKGMKEANKALHELAPYWDHYVVPTLKKFADLLPGLARGIINVYRTLWQQLGPSLLQIGRMVLPLVVKALYLLFRGVSWFLNNKGILKGMFLPMKIGLIIVSKTISFTIDLTRTLIRWFKDAWRWGTKLYDFLGKYGGKMKGLLPPGFGPGSNPPKKASKGGKGGKGGGNFWDNFQVPFASAPSQPSVPSVQFAAYNPGGAGQQQFDPRMMMDGAVFVVQVNKREIARATYRYNSDKTARA